MTWPKSVLTAYQAKVNQLDNRIAGSAVTSINLSDAPFYDILSLCDYLDTDSVFLECVLSNIGACYSKFYIDKDTKRISKYNDALNLREVNAPCKGLKNWQLKLMEFFNTFPKHPANYAFMEGKSIKDAAQSIAESEVLIHVDLKDFFPSHSALYLIYALERIIKERGWNVTSDAINAVVRLCCLANHELPQGSPCSPLLTIICNVEMDNRLAALAEKYNGTYSRYADDLWFGSSTGLNGSIKQFLTEVKDAVHPFRVNFKKLNVMRERALPLLEGYTISTSQPLTSAQWARIANHIRTKLEDVVDARLSYSDKIIKIEFSKRPEIPINDILNYGLSLLQNVKGVDTDIEYKVKPDLFYVQSVKKCLGMHIHKDQVKFPRKKYNDLRMQAFLFGRQRALYRKLHSGQNRGLDIRAVLTAFASLRTVNATSFRNLMQKPMNRRSFNGKVAFLASIDPEKAAKIKAVEQEAFQRCTEQIDNYYNTVGLRFAGAQRR